MKKNNLQADGTPPNLAILKRITSNNYLRSASDDVKVGNRSEAIVEEITDFGKSLEIDRLLIVLTEIKTRILF